MTTKSFNRLVLNLIIGLPVIPKTLTTAVSGLAGRTLGLLGAGRFRITLKFSIASTSLSNVMGILMHCLSPDALPKMTGVVTAV